MRWLRRIGRILLGYLAAALAASILLHVLLIGIGWMQGDSDVLMGMSMLVTVSLGTLIIALNAFLPALIVVAFAERRRVRSWYAFTVGGGVAALATLLIVSRFRLSGIASMSIPILLVGMAAGAVAGFVYWAVAGRTSGIGAAPEASLP